MNIDTDKLIKSPEVTFDYDKRNESLQVTVEVPGVDDEDAIDLKISACGFCISADTSSTQYKGWYSFFHEVDGENAKIQFRNGTLSISLPFFAPLCGKQTPIDMDIAE